MQLVSDINRAVPFGIASSAQSNADTLAADLAAAGVTHPLTGAAPSLSVVPLPPETPYGPWWVIEVKVGDQTRYIAD